MKRARMLRWVLDRAGDDDLANLCAWHSMRALGLQRKSYGVEHVNRAAVGLSESDRSAGVCFCLRPKLAGVGKYRTSFS